MPGGEGGKKEICRERELHESCKRNASKQGEGGGVVGARVS